MTRAWFAVAALAVALSTVAAATGSPPRTGDTVERSAALTRTTAADVLAADGTVPAAAARAVAEELSRAVPLPAGGTFDGIRWEQLDGALSRREIGAMLQYNAACQWLRAWRDGRDAAVAHEVLAAVPQWSAWQGAELSAVLARVAADVAAGGGETAKAMLVDCDATHERELRYATALGLSPSR